MQGTHTRYARNAWNEHGKPCVNHSLAIVVNVPFTMEVKMADTGEHVPGPAEVSPLRAYKPKHTNEDAIKKELHKLGLKLAEGARDMEGSKLAQLTVLAADYVELQMRQTNDRSGIRERDIRAFIKLSIGYGDENGRVSAEDRSSTIEALLAVSAKAAFLYHHAFNGCDIRYFVGSDVTKEGTKGAIPRLAMPFNKWLPRFRLLGKTEMSDNKDTSYKPLPAWAINAQYALMVDPKAKLDQDTGRIVRDAAPRQSEFQRATAAIEQAIREPGNMRDYYVIAAAEVLTAALRANTEALKSPKVEEAMATLFLSLDKWAEAKEHPALVRKTA